MEPGGIEAKLGSGESHIRHSTVFLGTRPRTVGGEIDDQFKFHRLFNSWWRRVKRHSAVRGVKPAHC
jgi:hypothetical protein